MFLYTLRMTSSIPDGLSTADLMAMLGTAINPDESQEKKRLTQREISEIVVKHVDRVHAELNDLSAYKHVAMYALWQLFQFHNKVSTDKMDGDKESALCWGRDAGWLQVCMNTLRNVVCGELDFFAVDDDEDCD